MMLTVTKSVLKPWKALSGDSVAGNSPSLWTDCERVPFQYTVHAFQHNERMIGRFLLGLPSEMLNRLSYYQHQRRLAGSIDPLNLESWLWAYSQDYEKSGVSFAPHFWRNALTFLGLSVFQPDPETGALIPVTPIKIGELV